MFLIYLSTTYLYITSIFLFMQKYLYITIVISILSYSYFAKISLYSCCNIYTFIFLFMKEYIYIILIPSVFIFFILCTSYIHQMQPFLDIISLYPYISLFLKNLWLKKYEIEYKTTINTVIIDIPTYLGRVKI